jgi:hypothetical protein
VRSGDQAIAESASNLLPQQAPDGAKTALKQIKTNILLYSNRRQVQSCTRYLKPCTSLKKSDVQICGDSLCADLCEALDVDSFYSEEMVGRIPAETLVQLILWSGELTPFPVLVIQLLASRPRQGREEATISS